MTTAENLATTKLSGGVDGDRSPSAAHEGPKVMDNRKKRTSATVERVTERLGKAWLKVASNKGAPGSDGMTIEATAMNLGQVLKELKTELETGSYEPGEIRRVYIPKPGGKGQRGLGIPNVRDRIVQEAVRQVIEPLYEPEFHQSSHGFRPGRSCQTAIKQAQAHVKHGYNVVVDFDLAKYFDTVNHQRLMARLAEKLDDKGLLILIGKMLKAKVVMPEGVVVRTEEGVPQGGPLSPLLSNVVLDELDQELERRGHRFVRYADDCNIFVKSERAGHRVMASIVRFLEKRLRLKVNQEKSAVADPNERHFVGFRLKADHLAGKVEILLSERTKKRIDEKIKTLTPRNWGKSMTFCIEKINSYLVGWIGFFGICTEEVERTLGGLDAHIRRRLRALQLKHWRRKETMAKRMISLGTKRKTAWKNIYESRKSIWKLSISGGIHKALSNKKFEEWGLVSLKKGWQRHRARTVAQGVQLELPFG